MIQDDEKSIKQKTQRFDGHLQDLKKKAKADFARDTLRTQTMLPCWSGIAIIQEVPPLSNSFLRNVTREQTLGRV